MVQSARLCQANSLWMDTHQQLWVEGVDAAAPSVSWCGSSNSLIADPADLTWLSHSRVSTLHMLTLASILLNVVSVSRGRDRRCPAGRSRLPGCRIARTIQPAYLCVMPRHCTGCTAYRPFLPFALDPILASVGSRAFSLSRNSLAVLRRPSSLSARLSGPKHPSPLSKGRR